MRKAAPNANATWRASRPELLLLVAALGWVMPATALGQNDESAGGWSYLGPRLEPSSCCVRRLGTFPGHPETLAVHDGLWPSSFGHRQSLDGGETWEMVSYRGLGDAAPGQRDFEGPESHLGHEGLPLLVEDPLGGRLYFSYLLLALEGPWVDRLWSSGDGGASWTLRSERHLSWLAVTGANPDHLASLRYVSPGTILDPLSPLEVSFDGGESWSHRLSEVAVAAQSPADPKRLLAIQRQPGATGPTYQLRISRDGGDSWGSPARLPFTVEVLDRLEIGPEGAVYFMSYRFAEVWRSLDGGESFEKVLEAPLLQDVLDVAPSLVDPELVFVVIDHQLHRSTDGGSTFAPLPTLDHQRSTEVLASRRLPGVVVASPYRRSPSGLWERIGDQRFGFGYGLLRAPGSMLAYLARPETGEEPTLLRSLDEGLTWRAEATLPGRGEGSAAIVGQASDSTLYFLQTSLGPNAQLSRSDDEGVTWRDLSSLEAFGTSFRLAAHRPRAKGSQPVEDTLVAMVIRFTSIGPSPSPVLFLSRDSGRNWTLVDEGIYDDRHLALDSQGRILVESFGLLRRREHDGTWSEIHPGQPSAFPFLTALLADAESGLLFAAVGGAIYRSADDGDTWVKLSSQMKADHLSFDATTGVLLVSNEAGVYSRRFDPLEDCGLGPALCLRGRFHVQLEVSGSDRVGEPFEITEDTGAFWLFDDDNLEVVVKVLDGCVVNGHYWVFAAGLTDLEARIDVRDALTGATWTRNSAAGPFVPIQDTQAFRCSP